MAFKKYLSSLFPWNLKFWTLNTFLYYKISLNYPRLNILLFLLMFILFVHFFLGSMIFSNYVFTFLYIHFWFLCLSVFACQIHSVHVFSLFVTMIVICVVISILIIIIIIILERWFRCVFHNNKEDGRTWRNTTNIVLISLFRHQRLENPQNKKKKQDRFYLTISVCHQSEAILSKYFLLWYDNKRSRIGACFKFFPLPNMYVL